MLKKYLQKIKGIYQHVLFKNSYWGVAAHLSQVVLMSLFFVIIARKYSTGDFADYIIATVLYQLVASFSSLGLSQWFIREICNSPVRNALINQFIKAQFFLGLLFYGLNILLAFLIYDDEAIRWLTVIIGINIIFDNIINAIKSLNIADYEQKRTFVISVIESFLKFAAVCLVFIFPLSILLLSILIVVLRFITLNLYLRFGSAGAVTLKALRACKISFVEIKHIVFINWPFIVIGSLSILNWRISNIIISKVLTVADLANYEISYKIFSIAQLLPVIVGATFFPSLVNLYKEGNMQMFKSMYRKVYLFYALFGLISYTFIYSFADVLLPLAFGSNYLSTSIYTKQMFLTIIVFPTVFLQANFLIAMKLEKLDMWLNAVALLTNLAVCIIGLHYSRSLLVINLSIFMSFIVFHLLQDFILIRRKVSSPSHVLAFYIITASIVFSYIFLSTVFNSWSFFVFYWVIILLIVFNGRGILNKLLLVQAKAIVERGRAA